MLLAAFNEKKDKTCPFSSLPSYSLVASMDRGNLLSGFNLGKRVDIENFSDTINSERLVHRLCFCMNVELYLLILEFL